MITVSDLSLSFSGQALFSHVDLLFTEGNCYGVIGANGAGKSTFLRILSGELEPTGGTVSIDPKLRMSVLKQDHHAYDDYTVFETILMGNPRLYEVLKEKDALYAKEDFSDEDGDRAAELEADEGTFRWGVSTSQSFFPSDNSAYFNGCDLSILEWLGQYSSKDTTETYLRGFLGKMLFSGDEVYKPVKVLSGGEKVRCMLSRMMLYGSNVIVLDQPTNHLDLESITAVNHGVAEFKGIVLFASHDHQFVQTIANRIIELGEGGCRFDRSCTYDEYLELTGAIAQA